MNSTVRYLFDLSEFGKHVDLSRLQYYYTDLNGIILAIASDTCLVLTDDVSFGSSQHDPTVRIAIEFDAETMRVTSIAWVAEDVICVGFESGIILGFNLLGDEIFEVQGHKSAVQSIKVSHNGIRGHGPGVWVLFEGGYMVTIPLAELLNGNSYSLMAFRCGEQEAVNDFVFNPHIFIDSIFDSESIDNASHCVVVGGVNSAMTMYNIGSEEHLKVLSKLGSAKEKPISIFSKAFSLFDNKSKSNNRSGNSSGGSSIETKTITMDPSMSFQDKKRRIIRLSACPSGEFIAAADALGRVTLFSTQMDCVVRLWKGLRDARLAWTHAECCPPPSTMTTTTKSSRAVSGDNGNNSIVSGRSRSSSIHSNSDSVTGGGSHDPNGSGTSSSSTKRTLCLAIYAPLLGLVSIYEMANGPCLRCIPAGLQCQLMTLIEESALGERYARCVLMRCVPGSLTVELLQMDPFEHGESDLDLIAVAVEGGDLLVDDAELDANHSGAEGGGVSDAAAELSGNEHGSESSLSSDDDKGGDVYEQESNAAGLAITRSMSSSASRRTAKRIHSAARSEAIILRKAVKTLTNLISLHKNARLRAESARSFLSSFTPVAGYTKFIDTELISDAETTILSLLEDRSILSTACLLRIIAMVEDIELYGCIQDTSPIVATALSGSSTGQLQFGKPNHKSSAQSTKLIHISHADILNFSVSFHRRLLSRLHSSVIAAAHAAQQENTSELNTLGKLIVELRYRLKLADAFSYFLDMHIHESDMSIGSPTAQGASFGAGNRTSIAADLGSSPGLGLSPTGGGGGGGLTFSSPPQSKAGGGASALLTEEAASICRQNTYRAEALCWSLRLAKNVERMQLQRLIQEQQQRKTNRGAAGAAGLRMGGNKTLSHLHGGGGSGGGSSAGSSGRASPKPVERGRSVVSPTLAMTHARDSFFSALSSKSSVVDDANATCPFNPKIKVTNFNTAGSGAGNNASASPTPPISPLDLNNRDRGWSVSSSASNIQLGRDGRFVRSSGIPGGSADPHLTGPIVGLDAPQFNFDHGMVNFSNFRAFHTTPHRHSAVVGSTMAAPPMSSKRPHFSSWELLRFVVESDGGVSGVRSSGATGGANFTSATVGGSNLHDNGGGLSSPMHVARSGSSTVGSSSPSVQARKALSPVNEVCSSGTSSGSSGLRSRSTSTTGVGGIASIYRNHKQNRSNPDLSMITGGQQEAFHVETETWGLWEEKFYEARAHIKDDAAVKPPAAAASMSMDGEGKKERDRQGDSRALPIGDMAPSTVAWNPSKNLSYALLSFIASPLLGDLFSLNAYASASKLMGLTGPNGIRQLLPLFLSYLEHQPIGTVISKLLTKKISSSPFQRWLRDNLLTFQDIVTQSASAVFQKIEAANNAAAVARAAVAATAGHRHHEEEEGEELTEKHSSTKNNLAADLDSESTVATSSGTTPVVANPVKVSIAAPFQEDDDNVSVGSAQSGKSTGNEGFLPLQRNDSIMEDSRQLNELTVEILEDKRLKMQQNDFVSKSMRSSGKNGAVNGENSSSAATSSLFAPSKGSASSSQGGGGGGQEENDAENKDEMGGGGNGQESADDGAAAADDDGSTNGGAPSYDDFVRHVMRPAWLYARRSRNLEHALSFASAVLETLYAVSDQVERRTYGLANLKRTAVCWENLVRQLRVALLLSSRVDAEEAARTEFTVESLSTGRVSLHRLLAGDTLSFVNRAEQAIEHEERCQEVYSRRVNSPAVVAVAPAASSASSSSSSDTKAGAVSTPKADVLLAWGNVADQRWRDLLALAVAEDEAAEHQFSRATSATAAATTTVSTNSTVNSGHSHANSPVGSQQQQQQHPQNGVKNESTRGQKSSGSSTIAGGVEDVAVAAAAAHAAAQARKKAAVRRRRPLLLYFPKHSHLQYLGSYRAFILAERWSVNANNMELLTLVSEHLAGIAPDWRAAAAADIYRKRLLPFLRMLLMLDEDPSASLFSLTAAAASAVGPSAAPTSKVDTLNVAQADNSTITSFNANEAPNNHDKAAGGGSSGGSGGSSGGILSKPRGVSADVAVVFSSPAVVLGSNSRNQMLTVLADINLLKTFVRALVDVLQYIQIGVNNRDAMLKRATASTAAASADASAAATAMTPSPIDSSTTTTTTSSSSSSSSSSSDSFHDETIDIAVTWPTNKDPKVSALFESFEHDAASVARWNSKIISTHISMLWTMQLRFQCGLRGLKASKLVGEDIYHIIDYVAQTNANIVMAAYNPTAPLVVSPELLNTRFEFLNQCLRRLALSNHSNVSTSSSSASGGSSASSSSPANSPPPPMLRKTSSESAAPAGVGGGGDRGKGTGVAASAVESSATAMGSPVYKLAAHWGISADTVKLMHLASLVENGHQDEAAELLIPQISDSGKVVDTLCAALRVRLGGVVARIDRLAAFGTLLASMDSEAVVWAKKALPPSMMPDAATIEHIAKGRILALNINLQSTRHLVICMQGILLAVPMKDRYGSSEDANNALGAGGPAGALRNRNNSAAISGDTNASSSSSSTNHTYGSGGVETSNSWLARKGRCDALLSLCNSFAHLSASQISGAGKK